MWGLVRVLLLRFGTFSKFKGWVRVFMNLESETSKRRLITGKHTSPIRYIVCLNLIEKGISGKV